MRYIFVDNFTRKQYTNFSFHPVINSINEDTLIVVKVNEDLSYIGDDGYKIPGDIPKFQWVIKAGGHIAFALFTKDIYDLRFFLASIVYACRKFGVETIADGRNDVYITVDGKKKKFSGCSRVKCGDWNLVGGSVTFDFNVELGKQAFGDNIIDKVGGLWEVKNIDIEMWINTVVNYITNRLNDTVKKDVFSKIELDNFENFVQ
jgi:lipoate-protein ligase A